MAQPLVNLRPGHEACETCDTCGAPVCPDCDVDGRSCMGGTFCTWAPQDVDMPAHRRRPRR